MIKSTSRGHEIIFLENEWIYEDTKEPVSDKRQCKFCGLFPDDNKVDPCLGNITGAISACCGHGIEPMYIVAKIELKLSDKIKEDDDIIASAFYPNEGNRIEVRKGLSKAYFEKALIHELSHFVDWYISKGIQSNNLEIREQCAESIEKEITMKMNEQIKREIHENGIGLLGVSGDGHMIYSPRGNKILWLQFKFISSYIQKLWAKYIS